MSASNQANHSDIAFHPQSPIARLANLGLIAHVHIEPPLSPPPGSKGTVSGSGGGTSETGGTAESGGMELEKFVANLGATLTLAAHTLSKAPPEGGLSHQPAFQPRNFTINMNVHAGWDNNGNIMLRSTSLGSKAEEVSQLTISFEPLPLIPVAEAVPKASDSKP
jgi:hypothetical protein